MHAKSSFSSFKNFSKEWLSFCYLVPVAAQCLVQRQKEQNKIQPWERISHQRCSIKKKVFFNKESLFLIKLLASGAVNFVKFLRTSFLQNNSWRLLLPWPNLSRHISIKLDVPALNLLESYFRCRCIHSKLFCLNTVLKYFVKFTRKHLQ